MHFGITEELTTDCVSPYNNAGLVSKVSEKIASENAENASRGFLATLEIHGGQVVKS